MTTVETIKLIIFLMCWSFDPCKATWRTSAAEKQAAFMKTLDTYSIVKPAIVDENGNHVTRDLREIHTPRRFRRELFSRNSMELPSKLYLSVNIPRTGLINLNLSHNSDFLSKGFLIERRGQNLSESKLNRPSKHHRCHYRGHVVGNETAKVALSVCNGLRGMIWTVVDEYFIEPVLNHVMNSSRSHPHVMYKRSALPDGDDPFFRKAKTVIQNEEERVRPITENLCGVTAQSDDYERMSERQDHREGESDEDGDYGTRAYHRRSKRSISRERFVETLVVADHNMYQYYHDQDLELYVLTIMNMVTALYHDASLGNLVNIVLVRLLILTEEEESLNITHHANNVLSNFCVWQNDLNAIGDDHPSHHDTALLFTRKDICIGMNEPCATLGLAHVSGMCENHRSCTINEDSGLGMAYTVGHEMGHLFGMNHDGDGFNDCRYPEPGTSQLMASQLKGHRGPMKWSRCSRDYISRFLDRGWGDCLLDEPAPHEFNFPHLPAGIMYSADYQCKLLFKRNSTFCSQHAVQLSVCSTLWCQLDHYCISKTIPAAPGTACGKDKWCYENECVKISEPPPPIPGGWGEWGEWSECSRTCGGGVMIQDRHCDNPAPTNGGRYCEGKRKNYALCNRQPCPKGSVDFRALQCSNHDNTLYFGRYYRWVPIIERGKECHLHCHAFGYRFSAEVAPMVIDGTPCGARSKDVCINGICYKVGCDNRIGSSAVEDYCGVCHGDGSSCKQITEGFNHTVKTPGPVIITVIPAGARTITVEEKSESSNYIELQEMTGRSIFNSHGYNIEGEYTVDNDISTVTYRTKGSMEKITIKGPLNKPINIVCNIRTRTPNIEYRYYLPKSLNESSSLPSKFVWRRDEWTPCSTTCGNGTQRSVVHCVNVMEGVVDDSYCEGTKPNNEQRACNQHVCPASWWIGPWQSCSVTCSNGVKKRSVFCIRSLSSDEQIAIPDAACVQHGTEAKPPTSAACTNYPCPSEHDWTVGTWSECSASCGQGTQQRDVECRRPDQRCTHESRPESERPCTSDCSYDSHSSLAEGSSSYILESSYPDSMGINSFGRWENQRLKLERKTPEKNSGSEVEGPINLGPIMVKVRGAGEMPRVPHQLINALQDSDHYSLKEWKLGPWSECSVTCGRGTKTRSVICVQAGTNLYTTGCPDESRPTALDPCEITCPLTEGHRCTDNLGIAQCRMAKTSGQCSLPAFRKLCCATCEN